MAYVLARKLGRGANLADPRRNFLNFEELEDGASEELNWIT